MNPVMKASSIFLIVTCFFLLGCQRSPDGYDLEGNPFYLADYKGKWVIVNYWASWCSPCLKELPALNTLHLSHQNQLVILGVNFDDLSKTQLRNLVKKLGLQFPQLKAFAKEKWGVDELATLPVTLLISPSGNLKAVLNGPQDQLVLLKKMGLSNF